MAVRSSAVQSFFGIMSFTLIVSGAAQVLVGAFNRQGNVFATGLVMIFAGLVCGGYVSLDRRITELERRLGQSEALGLDEQSAGQRIDAGE